MVNQESNGSSTVKHRQRHEGPGKHIIVFIFSIVLTLIAFAAVAASGVNIVLVILMLLVMAVMQVLVQLGYWMHMKDKGHMIPIIFMVGGFFVAVTTIIAALYWMWW